MTVDDEESAFLRGLATVLAEALARAQATELERAAVETFQRALLPDDRFSPVLDVATRYEPALDEVAIGGDWFDVFDLGPDRLGIAVGDVVGNGIDAAAVMGRLRSALHAIAEVVEDPGVVLTHLDRYADEIRGAAGTTVFFGVYDRARSRLDYSCAAHPPPVVLHAGASVAARGRPRHPTGNRARRPVLGCRRASTLAPADLLVLYTDGLVERRGETIDTGIGRLADLVASLDGRPIEELADVVLATLDPEGRRDDTVLVCARVPPRSAPATARSGSPLRRPQLAALRRRPAHVAGRSQRDGRRRR